MDALRYQFAQCHSILFFLSLSFWNHYLNFLLEKIPKDSIKDMGALDKLIAYLKRNKPYIPFYAVRKELGLCNSSAIGEKMNDLVVSERQKHNGMSWSKSGSVSLATITALKRNKESDKWFEEKELDFKLAA